MAMYSDVVEFLASDKLDRKSPNRRELLTPEEAQKLRLEYPGIPEAFIAYLCEVGCGAFQNCNFTVYGWLATPAEMPGGEPLKMKERGVHLLIFGDGFDGDFVGFIPAENWTVAIWMHDCGGDLARFEEPFEVLIRKRMGMDLSGELCG